MFGKQMTARSRSFQTRRYTALGYSDYIYEDGTNWLVREKWYASGGNIFDLVRYQYTNGRPHRVEIANVSGDLQTYNGYTTYYLQYNWHGRKRSPMNTFPTRSHNHAANACERYRRLGRARWRREQYHHADHRSLGCVFERHAAILSVERRVGLHGVRRAAVVLRARQMVQSRNRVVVVA